jgi:peptidyl-prolyl cis-trans isomerase C
LTAEERDLALVTFDGGKVTLKNWLDTLCEVAPPRRPTDLNTPEGVERLLNIALRIPILVNEAKLLGLDKDRNFVKQVKDIEDSHVLQKVQLDKFKDINEPTKEQIIDYYNKNKESFITDRTIKIDQIWCQDLKTAQQTKAQLDGGKDFEAVKQLYSLEKTGKPFDTYIGSEGLFFKDLWKGEPNQILGPLKGFYNEGIKWRIVKILEKKPGAIKAYSDDIRESVKRRMISEQRNALLEKYGKALLEKYKFEIYEDRIKDIDPLNIP